MKKHFIFAAIAAAALGIAHAGGARPASLSAETSADFPAEASCPPAPVFVENAFVPSWRDNWQVAVQCGANAFVGSPVGCGDLFDRAKPALQASVGKWHTPSVGTRLVFQGFELKSCDLAVQRFSHWHADFMLNLSHLAGFGSGGCRWDAIPFVGLGVIDNRTARRSPFAISYGLQGRCRISKGLHLTAEISNATSFCNADGRGCQRQLGDNLLSLTAGLSWTFGRQAGFRKIADARPYIERNERLEALARAQQARIEQLRRSGEASEKALSGLRRMLAAEGLLEKCAGAFDNLPAVSGCNPANDYSGLNSLRERIGKPGGLPAAVDEASAKPGAGECLGAPVFFFFKLGSTQLVDDSQLANIAEIARIAARHGLSVMIEGAADAATGTGPVNSSLAEARARRVAELMAEHGVDPGKCVTVSAGGIADYSPQAANRIAIVRLCMAQDADLPAGGDSER